MKKTKFIYTDILKPTFDFLISFILLPFLFVAIIFISIAIVIDDFGPVFFVSKRIGRNGKIFNMIKFRSMKVNSPDLRLTDGSTFNSKDDSRVTKIGRFLRKTSFDEIPQILNVFTGKMSFVGPRPDPPDWLERYPPDIRYFLKSRPGLTGYNQAYFRNSADGTTKMKNDLYYAQHCSFWLDVKIFFKTIQVVLSHKNLYKDTIK